MKSLLDACCERCTHTPEKPCQDYLFCRTEGPICHDDSSCQEKRKQFIEQKRAKTSGSKRILICAGTGCASLGAVSIVQALSDELEKHGLTDRVEVVPTGCHGFCEQGPTFIIEPEGTLYVKVSLEDIPEIINEEILNGKRIERLLTVNSTTLQTTTQFNTNSFFEKQERVVLKNCGFIDPKSIEDYIINDGYKGFVKAVQNLSSDEVIEEVKKSGLRGRGGAGFSTGLKWSFCRQAPGDKKYIICNADEGDPGAFMDRGVLEGDPHSVIEGMLIGAYAIGADEGYVYCRAEYPLAIQHLEVAIAQAEKIGLLGDNILNTGFNFRLEIRQGAGAFVCGEETALMASIEGKRGMPRVRPPFPAQSGLWGKPTNINNVETWSNLPHILRNGADWYGSFGTEKSKGTKIFALTGQVNNTGLVEVPMGTTLREIIFDIGGGIINNRKFKAVQIGGPSGGCLPEELLDLQVDYETLTKAGAMVGSGGLVIMDESTCMVDIARFFLNFSQSESCGKCTPCREGNKRMWEILDRIVKGQGEMEDLERLESLAMVVKDTSLCGLGQNSPNPILSSLKYFRGEFEAHIKDKKCPAHVCTALLTYFIEVDKCKKCGLCAKNCPVNCISGDKNNPYVIDSSKCINCGTCQDKCKFGAVIKQ
ncbi:MAG: NADH-quinone oxidoreductase subunit NuoF [Desulfitobacterium hafniense]|nr:NADH-quinone oxidoreductase subunit NuoF [Desulfitobacterium hafniense]